MFPWVIASAPGFGPGWASAIREPGASGDLTIRLVEEGLPIEGRVVNLEGRPVAGAAPGSSTSGSPGMATWPSGSTGPRISGSKTHGGISTSYRRR